VAQSAQALTELSVVENEPSGVFQNPQPFAAAVEIGIDDT